MDMTVKPEKPTPRPGVMDIHPYVPGESGDGNGPVIKLASNESPLGPSPLVREALMAALDDIGLYPDGSATALRHEIGRVYGLDPDLLVAGNGSEQLIAYLAQIYAGPGDEIIQSEFGFIAYRIATLAAGADLVVAPEKNYTSDVDAILAAVTQKTKTVFLANPNNPTGTYIPGAEVKRLRAQLPSHILLVLDASTGQNAIQQAREFINVTDVNAIALTKLDGTAKGGVVLGITDQFQVPVKYIGVGENADQLQAFQKGEFIDSLFKN